jgi:hypothetical protein
MMLPCSLQPIGSSFLSLVRLSGFHPKMRSAATVTSSCDQLGFVILVVQMRPFDLVIMSLGEVKGLEELIISALSHLQSEMHSSIIYQVQYMLWDLKPGYEDPTEFF